MGLLFRENTATSRCWKSGVRPASSILNRQLWLDKARERHEWTALEKGDD
jgi:hypothetical protein